MKKVNKKILYNVFLLLFVNSLTALASGGEGHKAEDPKGAKKEENFSGRQTQEWVDHLNQLNAAKAKMDAQKKVVDDLLVVKHHTTEPAKLQEVITKLSEEHKKLNTDIHEYEKMRNTVRFRFPEKGVKELRTYERAEIKSLNEYENSFSVETKLSQTVEKMREKYKSQDKKKLTVPDNEPKVKEESAKSQEKKSPEVTDSILMIK